MWSVGNKFQLMAKILIVGDFHSNVHEDPIYSAFLKLGHEAHKFSWWQYFEGYPYGLEGKKNFLKSFYYRFQNKFLCGPALGKINKDLVVRVKEIKPDLVFIYRGTHICGGTIKKIKKEGTVVMGYNNDDPFNKKYPFYFWRIFKKAIWAYDFIFVYRQKNIEDYKKKGYEKVSILRSFYARERFFPIDGLLPEKYSCDVIFVGHWEDDGREEYIKEIIKGGINLRLCGPEWENSKHHKYFIEKLGDKYSPVYLKEDYNLALNSAKIGLVFLSKLNNDTYTRKCFEIIAAKKMMLGEYTEDLNGMFREGVEAQYFRSKEEMIEKTKYYLRNEVERKKIAQAGYERLLKDGHEVSDRAKEIIKTFERLKGK